MSDEATSLVGISRGEEQIVMAVPAAEGLA